MAHDDLAAIAPVVFGSGGKLSQMVGDAGKGVKAFKDGLKDEPGPDDQDMKTVTGNADV